MDLNSIVLSIIAATIFVIALILYIRKENSGNKEMQHISKLISKGAITFLTKEYKVISIVAVIITILLGTFISVSSAISYLFGAIISAFTGFIGLKIATMANVRTAQAARKSISNAFRIAISSGAVMGLSVVALGLLGIIILYFTFQNPEIIYSFAFGASSVALFARVGGGIFTKAADVGADLVGKIELNIPEDDHRNPASIADNVGDNVGDVAGMGADLFESYVGSIIAAMILGFALYDIEGLILPMIISAGGIIASIVGLIYLQTSTSKSEKHIHKKLRISQIIASMMVVIITFSVTMNIDNGLNIFFSVILGLFAGVIIGFFTEYHTSDEFKPVKKIAESSKVSSAMNIITGLSNGMRSTMMPIIIICITIYFSHLFLGLFGIAMSAVGMLSTLGLSLAIDAYGPVVDNAGGIAQMAKMPKKVRERTDMLDSIGNTSAAIGKGFAIGSAALTSLALFSAFTIAANLTVISITNPNVIIGILLGGMMPYIFSSLTLNAVEKSAEKIVREVERQFRTIKGLLQNKAEPDYKKCIEIASHSSLQSMAIPSIIAIIAPLIIGFTLGVEALGGLLLGTLVSGLILAIFMANTGGAWDNAKKLVEREKNMNVQTHNATIVGDTVGDPLKDTAGPSINILIKLMSIVAIVCLPLL